jgi:hypothetical protein
MFEIPWALFKTFVDDRSLSVQWIDNDSTYFMWAYDGPMAFRCAIYQDGSADQLAFEASYKAAGNKRVIANVSAVSTASIGSRVVLINNVYKTLYQRVCGIQSAVAVGTNTISYTIPFAWVRFFGVELFNGEALDYTDFKIFDTAGGAYSGVPNAQLNQFGYSANVAKDYYCRTANFDADLYIGMIIKLTYNSVSAKTIGLNFLLNEVT